MWDVDTIVEIAERSITHMALKANCKSCDYPDIKYNWGFCPMCGHVLDK